MSAAVNSMIGAQLDSIGRGTEGSEYGEESGALESRALQRTGLVFGSIIIEIAAPDAVFSHPSSIGAVGSELRVGADSCVASRALSGSRAKSCRPGQCGAPGYGSNPSMIKSLRMSAM